MIERRIYKEIPGGRNNFHSAVLTTFSFNLHHFEGQVLRTLKEKWITSINILADQNTLDDTLGVSSGYLKSIGQAYSISGIKSSGVFHPKINIFVGDESLLAVFGSGNITPGGHGKNHELFSGFYADVGDRTELPLLQELWDYVAGYVKQTEGYAAERINKTIFSCCSLLSVTAYQKHQYHDLNLEEYYLEAALLYNEKGTSSIYQQLSASIPADEVDHITIVCPYYDVDGSLLKSLCVLFPKANLSVYLQRNYGLPPIQMTADKRITFYDFDQTSRGKKKINGIDRMLHTKIFHFKSKSKEYCLVGSANATLAAIGNADKSPINDEFGVLYASPDYDFLKELGITKVSKPIKDISDLSRHEYYGDSLRASISRTKNTLKSVDLDGRQLKVYTNTSQLYDEPYLLAAFGQDGAQCFSLPINDGKQKAFEFTLSYEQLDSQPQYCAFVNAGGDIVSNKAVVNKLDKLRNTNPEKNLRNIREIIGKIEAGQFSELEIADYLAQFYREDSRAQSLASRSSSGEKREIDEKDLPMLTYDEAIATSDDVAALSKIANGHITSRLWQSLEHIFERRGSAIADELMDEEEEAKAEESKKRNTETAEASTNTVPIGRNIGRPASVVNKLTKIYCEDLRKAQLNNQHTIGIVDYLRYLLSAHVITATCHYTDYTSFPESVDEVEWKSSLRMTYLDSTLSIIKEFALLHQKREVKKYDESQSDLALRQDDLLNKTLYHILLSVTLAYNSLGKQETVIMERIALYCFNIFDKCGLPNDGLKDYIEKHSVSNRGGFYPPHVFRMHDEIMDTIRSGKFIKTEKLGVCKIDSVQGDKYRVKAIHNEISYSYVNKKDALVLQ